MKRCGARDLLYISDKHWYTFKEGFGNGTNNYAELSSLGLLSWMAAHKEVIDSQIIIKWIARLNKIYSVQLIPLLEETTERFERHDGKCGHKASI